MKFPYPIRILKKHLKHEKFIAPGADRFAKKRVDELTAAIGLLENADKIIVPEQTKLFLK